MWFFSSQGQREPTALGNSARVSPRVSEGLVSWRGWRGPGAASQPTGTRAAGLAGGPCSRQLAGCIQGPVASTAARTAAGFRAEPGPRHPCEWRASIGLCDRPLDASFGAASGWRLAKLDSARREHNFRSCTALI